MLIRQDLDCSTVSATYNFNEPWDSPNNRTVLGKDHWGYKCPADDAACAEDSTLTSYVAVAGTNAASWFGRTTAGGDGDPEKAATFLVVEMVDSGIPWLEPKDVASDDLLTLQSLAARGPHWRDNGYFFRETRGINALLLDRNMIFLLPCDSRPNVFGALSPPEKKESVQRDPNSQRLKPSGTVWRRSEEQLEIHWPHAIGLPVWLVAVGLLAYQTRRGRIARRQAATQACSPKANEPIDG
jgi:hypothetical protein